MNNHESPITSFTLRELITLAGGAQRQGLFGECIAANSASHLEAFRSPCRIDAFIIGIGTEGQSDVTFNLRKYRLQKDSLFVFGPQNILQIESNEHFRAHVLVVTPEFMKRINIDTRHMMPLFLKLANNPCINLTPEQSHSVRSFISLVEAEIKQSEMRFSNELIGELIGATIYKVGNILSRYLDEHPEADSPVQNRADEYFKQFMELLGEHYKQERSVSYYARRLCITPKYLTTLIKRISGHSVSDWIDTYVILEARTLLRCSNMSVQEVAYHLNFPNQSFFGSYFRRITGLSPSQYKAAQ